MTQVTVCITTYNRKEQASRALNSVFNQTYKNIEIIIVDDFSNDGTEAFLNELIPDFKNKVTYIRNTENKGLAYSRNIGLKNAKANWIVFLDDDDELTPESVEQKVNEFEKNNDLSNLAVVYSGAKIIHLDYKKEFYHKPQISGLIEKCIKKGILNTIPSSGLYNKNLLLKFSGFDENLKSFIDHDLWLSMSEAKYYAFYVDKPLVITYTTKTKRSMVTNVEHRIESIEIFIKKWENYLKNAMGYRRAIDFISNYQYKVIGSLMVRSLMVNNYTEFENSFKYLKNKHGLLKTSLVLINYYLRSLFSSIYHSLKN